MPLEASSLLFPVSFLHIPLPGILGDPRDRAPTYSHKPTSRKRKAPKERQRVTPALDLDQGFLPSERMTLSLGKHSLGVSVTRSQKQSPGAQGLSHRLEAQTSTFHKQGLTTVFYPTEKVSK